MWRIAAGDPQILADSGRSSQYLFYLIGLLYAIINVIIFFAVFGMFYGIFDGSWLVAASGSILFWFIFSNIYRLTLISMEPQTLRGNIKTGLSWFTPSNILRLFIVLFIAIYISKCGETVFFSWIYDIVPDNLTGKIVAERSIKLKDLEFNGGSGFMDSMKYLFNEHKWTNLITVCICILFVVPIALKWLLRSKHQYYSLKAFVDNRRVKTHYDAYKREKEKLLRLVYEDYRKDYLKRKLSNYIDLNYPSFSDQKDGIIQRAFESYPKAMKNYEFKEHESRFKDEPFRTELKDVDNKAKTTAEFMDLPNWWIKD